MNEIYYDEFQNIHQYDLKNGGESYEVWQVGVAGKALLARDIPDFQCAYDMMCAIIKRSEKYESFSGIAIIRKDCNGMMDDYQFFERDYFKYGWTDYDLIGRTVTWDDPEGQSDPNEQYIVVRTNAESPYEKIDDEHVITIANDYSEVEVTLNELNILW